MEGEFIRMGEGLVEGFVCVRGWFVPCERLAFSLFTKFHHTFECTVQSIYCRNSCSLCYSRLFVYLKSRKKGTMDDKRAESPGEGKHSFRDVTSSSQISIAPVGRENLSDAIPPHESYEGRHRYDPGATWTEAEERKLVWKTDLYLLSWICLMVSYTSLDS